MKKQEVRDMIYTGLNSVLAGNGFRLKKSEESFVRPISGGQQRIYVALWDYQPEFIFSLTMGVRLDAVEQVFHLFSGSPPKYQSMSMTTLTQLEYFTAGKRKEYKISTEAEISTALDDLFKIVTEKVLPFFEKYRDVPSIEAAVNSGSLPTRFDSTQLPAGAMHAVILAHLVGNPNFERMVVQFQDAMRGFPEVEKDKFNRLVAYLINQPSQNR
ncbi:MAG: hypothetical protein ONB46_23475 [candidate division KSB1 bacterium]|nr:hypothetical protein [candidate division KSB1 bacterium]MDZ7368828.1 hypothetical protein [candidate division KSB1 bacterium]MDZ7406672.1 hypothetical protein [candidate division KSB1 bacterium]